MMNSIVERLYQNLNFNGNFNHALSQPLKVFYSPEEVQPVPFFSPTEGLSSPIEIKIFFYSAPEGLSSPELYVVNDSSLRVSWMTPVKPNGDKQKYSIYVDGKEKVSDLHRAGSYILDNLEPYTIYTIQVRG